MLKNFLKIFLSYIYEYIYVKISIFEGKFWQITQVKNLIIYYLISFYICVDISHMDNIKQRNLIYFFYQKFCLSKIYLFLQNDII